MNASIRATLAATLASLAASACATLPAPLAPVQPPPFSALEVQRAMTRDRLLGDDFTLDGVVVLPDNSKVEGRDALADWLLDEAGPGFRAFNLFPGSAYRCAADVGITEGVFRGTHRSALGLSPAAGRWLMRTRRAPGGLWQVEELAFLRPGSQPRIPDGCVSAAEELRSNSRFWVTGHLGPMEYRTARPHHGLHPSGAAAHHRVHQIRPGGQAAALYRLGSWASLGGRALVEPHRATMYVGKPVLTSSSALFALVAGYEGRNVAIDAGPGIVVSRWVWSEFGAEDDIIHRNRPGAAVSLHGTVPLRDGLGLNLLIQHRWLGSDVTPGPQEERVSGTGWYVALGLAVRSGY